MHWDKKELVEIVQVYADFLNVKLVKGWRKEVRKWFKMVDGGITQDELSKFFEESGHGLHSLKDAVKSLDKNAEHDDEDDTHDV